MSYELASEPMAALPARLIVVGGNATACQYAAALVDQGAIVTVIVPRGARLRFADRKQLLRLEERGVEVLFDRELSTLYTSPGESLCVLADGSAYPADRVLVIDDRVLAEPVANRDADVALREPSRSTSRRMRAEVATPSSVQGLL